jgi:general secretion pathway protein E
MGTEPFLVSSSVIAIMAQRLIRVICEECKEPFEPDEESLGTIGITPEMAAGRQVYRGLGCPACLNTGYSGRRGIFELMIFDDNIKNLMLKTSDANSIKREAVEQGMVTLRKDGAQKVLEGVTTIEEVFRVTQE